MKEYRSLSRITSIACAVVALYLVANWFSAIGMYLSQPRPADAMGLPEVLAVIEFLTIFVCVIVVGRWIYRASSNALALSGDPSISPGWAVGWYFIPFANLFKPLQAMKQVWAVTDEGDGYGAHRTPPILAWWWGLWIVTNILSNVSFRMSMNGTDGSVIATIDLVAAMLNFPLCIVLIVLMRSVSKAQDEHSVAAAFA
jgi:hypothetical protein